jgi:formate/nitrite transporter FocA (FNT family)
LNIRLRKHKLVTGNMQRIVTDVNEPDYSLLGMLMGLLLMFLFNAIGVLIIAGLGGAITNVGYSAALIAANKLAMPLMEVFARAIVCGYLMTIATRSSTPLWMTPLCVFAFVYTGMCHCVADVFYYSMLSGPSACLPHLGVTIAGNTLGAVGAAVTQRSPLQP